MNNYLSLCSGDRYLGSNWDSVDLDRWDLTELPVPFIDDNSYEAVYIEHGIEHFYKYQGINLCRESLRILKPNGILRVVWPSYNFIEKLLKNPEKYSNFVRNYLRRFSCNVPPNNTNKPEYEKVALALLSQQGEHLYLWEEEELLQELCAMGFLANIVEYNQSSISAMSNIDTNDGLRKLHSAVLEGKK